MHTDARDECRVVRLTWGERPARAVDGRDAPLGDDCVVEAGLYVTAGTKVTVLGAGEPIVVKARDLAGRNNIVFRRNSLTGGVEAVARAGSGVELNASLHANE